MVEYYNDQLPPYILNLQKSLCDSKNVNRLYHKTDSHWNLIGGYLAYQQIIDRLRQWYPLEEFRIDFTFQQKFALGKGGDLAQMLMIQDTMTEERPLLKDYPDCAAAIPFDLHLSDIGPAEHQIPQALGCPEAHLKAVVFHDSFLPAGIAPFLSENFNQIIYLWKQYNQQNMEQLLASFRPDVVIEERVERYLFLDSSK